MSASLQPHGLQSSGSSVHGISQARILESAATSLSGGSFQPRGPTCISCISRQILYQSHLQQLVKWGEPKVFHRNKHICFRSTLTSLAYLAIVSSPIRIIYQIKLQEPRRDTSMYFDHFHNRPTAYHSFPKPCIYNFYLFTLHYEDKIQ